MQLQRINKLVFSIIVLTILFSFITWPCFALENKTTEKESRIVSSLSEWFKKIPWNDYFQQGSIAARQLTKITYLTLSKAVHQVIYDLFTVKVESISGLVRLSEEQVINSIDAEQVLWLWQVLFGQIRTKLTKDPWIKDALLQWYIYPLKLNIDIEEEQPWIVAEYANDSWLIGDDGAVIESLKVLEKSKMIVECSELPRLDGLVEKSDTDTSLVGSNTRFRHAVRLLKLMRGGSAIPFAVDRYTLLPDGGFKISAKEAEQFPEVLIAAESSNEMSERVKQLSKILSDLERRGERARQIDLRFSGRSIVEPKS